MRAFLKNSERCFQLKSDTTTIGSHRGADIVLQAAGVADLHAALEFSASDNSFILQDFNSPHGTFVNSCQVQNAAVRVSPGDILSFGTAGVSFELVLDGAAQVGLGMPREGAQGRVGCSGPWKDAQRMCPGKGWMLWPMEGCPEKVPREGLDALAHGRMPRKGGWVGAVAQGRLQKQKFTHLVHLGDPEERCRRWVSGKSTNSRGLCPKRRGIRHLYGSFPPAPWAGGPPEPPATSPICLCQGDLRVPRAGARPVPPLWTPSAGPLRRGQGEKLLEKEMGHLFGLDTKGRDVVIRDLQEEIAATAKKLAQAAVRSEAELTQKLLTLNRELGAQTEEIKALREQVSDLQKGSNQVFSHSLHERDLEIGRLRRESEKLRREQALTAGLMSNMKRELVQKEQKIQQLQQGTKKLIKEKQEKDNQLAVVSAKCLRIKEEIKCELREEELISCRNRIEELEQDLEGLKGEIQKHESVQKQLAEKAKAEEELKAAWSQQAEQLREMGHRERLLRCELQRAGEQLESFKTRVMQVCSPSAAGSTGESVTEQQVIEKVRQISDESQLSHEREKSLQKELSSKLAKEEEVSANIEVFKNSLQKLQACLRSSCSSSSLRGELGQLEVLCLDPSVSAIRTAVVDMTRGPLAWLEGAEQLLDSLGMDLHTSGKGLLAALESLSEKMQEMAQSNQRLQEQLEKLQELQAELLQEHTEELEAKHEQDLEIKIQQIILEKDKELKQILESAVAEEKDKCKKSVEEEQKKIQELESHLRSMAEATAKKAEEQELTEGKLREALHELKKITAQEVVLQQQVLQQDQQLRAVQEENESQRQKLLEDVAGYREQSKQHSLTILALEDRLLEATQQQKVLEEEKAALVGEIEGLQCAAHRSAPGAWPGICPAMESHVCLRKLREELAVAQGTLLEERAVISRLSRELSETRARMSDMRGELSEEQKVELEHSQRQLKHREWEVNQLREKLSEMSSLVEEKDGALKAAAQELSQAQTRCRVLRDASQQTLESPEDAPRTPLQVGEASQRGNHHGEHRGVGLPRAPVVCMVAGRRSLTSLLYPHKIHGDAPQALFLLQVPGVWQQGCVYQTGQGPDFFQEPPSDLAEFGAKCRGLRHEETIQRQKEGLAELRERVKMLEKRQCSGNFEPLVVQMRDLPEKRIQQRGLELEPAPVLGEKLKAGKAGRQCEVPDRVPHGGSLRITSWEVAEATDLGEEMYLDVIGALGSLVEMKELSGMQPLQHLPQERRAEVGLQRQKALELLYKKIRNLQVRLERKEEMLKGYEGSVEQLRQSQASLRRCQEEMSKLEDEAHREAEEKALLREALERMQLQLDREKRLRQAAKRHKPGATKPLCSSKAKEHVADAVKLGSSREQHHGDLH
ncbi:forkhead-associated domain-containing protein 1 [Cyanistes caeruleus]|uniref:forkhead-associated domain-containing protein 1 n=1 Tax=Cyanistes caeruleus TaxID=156563 RepID=UPI000CDADD70|nr:forkhead-associated domain-containing protein 1 [Cyanistes caeruleus]